MYYAGIDAHKNYLTIAIVDNQGELVSEEGRVPIGDGEPLLAALEGPRPLDAVVEPCPFWPWLHDTLEPTEIGFHLANANRLEAIAEAETKTDSVDARLLARMLGGGLIPEVYPKPPEQRDLCRLIRHRKTLVEERTSLINRTHPRAPAAAGTADRTGAVEDRGGVGLAPRGSLALAKPRAAGPGGGTPGADRSSRRSNRRARRPYSG